MLWCEVYVDDRFGDRSSHKTSYQLMKNCRQHIDSATNKKCRKTTCFFIYLAFVTLI